jgi:hypothetical protein
MSKKPANALDNVDIEGASNATQEGSDDLSWKEQKTALIAAVACHMEGEAWNPCRLSARAVMPTIRRLRSICQGSFKCGWGRLTTGQQRTICEDRSQKTVMDACDGMMPAIESQEASSMGGLLDFRTAASLFRSEVMTTAWAAGTRQRYYPLWKEFVTFEIAHGALQEVMPASKDMVQAWALELMMHGGRPR